MAGLINKVKDAVTGTKNTPESAAANQGDNDYDNVGRGSGSGLTGSGNYSSDTYGSDNRGSGNDGYGSTDTSARGPHSSNLENKLDPRVDSDGSRNTSGGYGSGGAGSTGYGSSGTGDTGYGTTSSGLGSTGASTTAGPHSSNLANKVDPRVDSDQDGRRGYDSGNTSSGYGSGSTGLGSTGTGTGSSGYGSTTGTGTESSGYGGTSGEGLGTGEGRHGHHGQHHGHAEDIVHGGDHYTETANKLDPHVSGGDNTRLETVGGYGSGSGTSEGTSGPHKSNLLNKADPRVDSDRDGSNTYGGNRTT